MDELKSVLKALCDKPSTLHAAVDALEKLTPTPSEKQESGMSTKCNKYYSTIYSIEDTDYKELIAQYKESQAARKGKYSKKASGTSSSRTKNATPFFSVR